MKSVLVFDLMAVTTELLEVDKFGMEIDRKTYQHNICKIFVSPFQMWR